MTDVMRQLGSLQDGTWLPAPGDFVRLKHCSITVQWPPDSADVGLYERQEFELDFGSPFPVVSVTPRRWVRADGTTRVYDIVVMQKGRLGWFKRRVAQC